MAASRTFKWSVTVLAPALPGRRMTSVLVLPIVPDTECASDHVGQVGIEPTTEGL